MAIQNIQLGNQTEFKKLSKTVDTISEDIENIKPSTPTANLATIAFSNSAAGHNGIYRGKDLTGIYTIDEICQMVSDGTFEDLYIGDYITKTISTSYASNEEVDIVFAGFNNFLHNGSTEVTKNHITCVTKDCFKTTAAMYTSDSTSKGYYSSTIHSTVLPIYATALQSVLNNHIIAHSSGLTTAGSTSGNSMAGAGLTGYASNYSWYDANLCLMSDIELYGSTICSSSSYDTVEHNNQFSLFRLAPEYMLANLGKGGSKQSYWLSAITSSTSFAMCSADGYDFYSVATTALGVRPYFLIG